MTPPKADATRPPIRACIFDLDGLLINTEEIITASVNSLLSKYDRPPLPRTIRTQLMGVPDSTNSDAFHEWACLPITREQWRFECSEAMRKGFEGCLPIPGAERVLESLSRARSSFAGERIQLALASSTKSRSYKLKTSLPETKRLLEFIPPDRRVLGDDPRIREGRGKPAPDIYLLALQTINADLNLSDGPILPRECLVFEDSAVGVESARRAGMRVVWVPHEDVLGEYQARGEVECVLPGRVGSAAKGVGGDEQLGEIGDGWGEVILSLEDFKYGKYGVYVPT
ncbi:putative HAD superfamily hydrolase [Aspergillus undulatus]|uniref:putative HAD superfamily hydrolase n=1 Tax=Aspergillus undulatus TaxID=1810928 RepID=UPI003CCD8D9E